MTPRPSGTDASTATTTSTRWARRFALGTALSAVPLILFGGSVTTLGAGMAVEGWLEAEGHFMPLFPVEKWFRDTETMVEHTHRLFGVLVGLFAIATVVAAWRTRQRGLAIAGLLLVCAQGTLGGFRVLEDSPRLAFLHGAFAQAVFAVLVVVAAAFAPGRAEVRRTLERTARRAELARAAWIATGIVYLQIAVGAWYRHGLRTGEEGIAIRLALHFVGAFAAFLAVLALAKVARRVAASGAALASQGRVASRLVALLAVQIALGVLAWATGGAGEVSLLEWIVTVLHVLVGGLLLAQCAVAAVAARRPSETRTEPSLAAEGEGATA